MTTTVLITTFNRAKQLRSSLDRMTHLTKPDELLIVDDGSEDNTEEIVNSFKEKLPIKYIYNHNPQWSICSMARNIGVKNSLGDIIITSEPEMLWITDIVPIVLKEREGYPMEIISASIVYHQQANNNLNMGLITDPSAALKDEIVEEYQIQPRSYHPGGLVRTVNLQATFICMYEKQWLMDVGGWDEEFQGQWGWDDIDLATRLRINGVNQHVCKKMVALHQWHLHLPPHIQGQASLINETRMKEKKLDEVEQEIVEMKSRSAYEFTDPRLIANKGREWGIIRPR